MAFIMYCLSKKTFLKFSSDFFVHSTVQASTKFAPRGGKFAPPGWKFTPRGGEFTPPPSNFFKSFKKTPMGGDFPPWFFWNFLVIFEFLDCFNGDIDDFQLRVTWVNPNMSDVRCFLLVFDVFWCLWQRVGVFSVKKSRLGEISPRDICLNFFGCFRVFRLF